MRSRAEKKLANLKAKQEIEEIQSAKRAKNKQAWDDLPPSTKLTATVIMTVVVLVIFASIIGSAVANQDEHVPVTSNDGTEQSTQLEKEPKKPAIPKEYTSALAQAETYANDMHLSKKGLYEQLTSEYGGQFTKKAAQYAIDHVNANWKANALAQARTYQDNMHLSPAAIRDQLVSEYGAQFTPSEADYAISHLND